jgi:predicted metal-dependent phosphoesterase TrpH
MIDFHTHSSISDGVLSPTELISLASKKGLKYIALTDHNKIKGLPEAAKIAAQYGINFINGIELSCERNTHIIGLFLKRFDEINNKSIIRMEYMEQSLKNYGYTKEKYGSVIDARNAFIKMMIDKGKFTHKTIIIEHFLQSPFGYGEAIDMIHRSGGLAILAHPNKTKGVNSNNLQDFICELKQYGIDGIEVYQSGQTEDYTDFVADLAKKNDLLVSGGSDFHNLNPGNIHGEIGMYGDIDNRKPIPVDILDKLLQNKDRYL